MSVGPLGGLASSAAGSPLAQLHGSETERVQQDVGAQQRQVQAEKKAEAAAGIGETDGEDHETEERDADGRRLWEEAPKGQSQEEQADKDKTPRLSKDTSGQTGNLLDLVG